MLHAHCLESTEECDGATQGNAHSNETGRALLMPLNLKGPQIESRHPRSLLEHGPCAVPVRTSALRLLELSFSFLFLSTLKVHGHAQTSTSTWPCMGQQGAPRANLKGGGRGLDPRRRQRPARAPSHGAHAPRSSLRWPTGHALSSAGGFLPANTYA